MSARKRRLISASRVWTKCAMLGVGVGWDADDGTACLIIQAGRWIVVIGPHVAGAAEQGGGDG